jgi:hypothetical protein
LSIDAATGAINLATSTGGTYTVTYTFSNATTGCSNTATTTVTINSLPVVATHSQQTCAPGTIDLTASAVTSGSSTGLSFEYYTDAAASTPLSSANAVAVSGTYYIKGTDGNGCSVVSPIQVTINTQPTVVITNPSAVCAPATVDITASAVTAGSDANLSFAYYTDAAGSAVLSNPASITTSGTYYIQGTNTITGCKSIVMPVTVTMGTTLNVPTITTTAATCSFAGTATISNYNSAYTYTFTPSGPGVGTGGVITGMTAGTNYTLTAGNGTCTSTASSQFSVAAQLPGTTLSLSPASQTVCAGESATVNATVSGGATVTSWVSDLGGITAAGGVSLTTGALPNKGNQPYTITLTASATNGSCSTNQQATITVLPEPGVIINLQSSVVCDYEIPGLVISSLLPGTTIDWELVYTATSAHVSSGSGIDTVKPFASALPSGAYTLKVTGKKAGCTSKVVTASVIVN